MKVKAFIALATMCSLMLVSCGKKDEPQQEDPKKGEYKEDVKHEAVDLGLTSGTLWAICNVGATQPEEYGSFFAWGETAPKTDYSWSTYKYGSSNVDLTKYCTIAYFGKDDFSDSKTVLDAEDDAATVNWGSEWRMPTLAEQEELIDECKWSKTTVNGKKGYEVQGPNGNSIFLPLTGAYDGSKYEQEGLIVAYWSNTIDASEPYQAYYILCKPMEYEEHCYHRTYGFPVRAVKK